MNMQEFIDKVLSARRNGYLAFIQKIPYRRAEVMGVMSAQESINSIGFDFDRLTTLIENSKERVAYHQNAGRSAAALRASACLQEVEFVCSCISAVLWNVGLPVIVPLQKDALILAAKILGQTTNKVKEMETYADLYPLARLPKMRLQDGCNEHGWNL